MNLKKEYELPKKSPQISIPDSDYADETIADETQKRRLLQLDNGTEAVKDQKYIRMNPLYGL